MKILFIHPNMPGQYKHLARILAEDKNNQVVFLTKEKPDVNIPGITKVEYKMTREVSPETHRYLINLERAVFNGQEVWRVCNQLKAKGFVPDVVVMHPGWGDGLFIKDIFNGVPCLSFLEFYYSAYSGDVNFLRLDYIQTAPYTRSPDDNARVRLKNACNLYNLEICDWGVSPTHWQNIQNPKWFHSKISVLHDGIDTNVVVPPDGTESISINGKTLTKNDEVITYIARNFEPYRGLPTAMRAFKEIQKRRPNAHIVCVGADGVSYGASPPAGTTFRRMMLEETKPDMNRLHFIGYLKHQDMLNVLKVSSAHIYLTVPFVLSWSMMEAMASECVLLGSNTPPVMEVLKHEYNGIIIDFYDHMELADWVDKIFTHPTRMRHLGKAARQSILDHYSLRKLLPLHIDLIRDLANGHTPPPTAAKIAAFNPKPKDMVLIHDRS